jgi:hypothetical protein
MRQNAYLLTCPVGGELLPINAVPPRRWRRGFQQEGGNHV